MKKKTAAVFMTAVMTAAALAGCGSAGAQEDAGNTDTAQESDAGTAEEETTQESEEPVGGAEDSAVYKVGIVQYVDDASLNQIEAAIEAELDAKAAELGVTFDYADYVYNGQADATV